jgi:hypothetical protein
LKPNHTASLPFSWRAPLGNDRHNPVVASSAMANLVNDAKALISMVHLQRTSCPD